MEYNSNKIPKASADKNSLGTVIFRVLLNLSLLVLLRLYFFIPDMINKAKKYSHRKKIVANNMRIPNAKESLQQVPELK
jgi:hypothetical protein